MAVPRPLLIALLGAILLATAYYATQVMGAPAGEAEPSSGLGAATGSPDTTLGPNGASARTAAPPPSDGLPPRVKSAIAAHRVVVLLFTQPGAADDDATHWASRALDAPGVAVFRARISDIGNYKKVIPGAEVGQAPAIVVVDRNRTARVLEGYTDRGTLRQVVRDALR